MKGFSKIAFVLMMSLMLLAGCQSQVEEAATVVEAPAETAVPADIPAAPVQQTEEAAEDAVPATEPEKSTGVPSCLSGEPLPMSSDEHALHIPKTNKVNA